MIEAIILSMLALTAGVFVGIAAATALREKTDRIKKISLSGGKNLHVWEGFVDPNCIFIAAEDSDGSLRGDSVVFNKEGNIIFVDKHVEER